MAKSRFSKVKSTSCVLILQRYFICIYLEKNINTDTIIYLNCRYQYPLNEYKRENEAEDGRCLATVEEHIYNQIKLGVPVAGMVVEPIQAEGGDHHGSKDFFQVHSANMNVRRIN